MQTIAVKSRAPGGLRLLPHQAVALAVIGTPLRMADNDGACAGIRQHFGRDIAGMGARGLGMTILPPDRQALRARQFRCKSGNQRCGRTHQQIGLPGDLGGPREHGLELGHRGAQAVHFPVAGDQGPNGSSSCPKGSLKGTECQANSLAEPATRPDRPKPAAVEPLTLSFGRAALVAGRRPPLYDALSIR